MPASTYALVAFFAGLSVAAGLVAARILGPRRAWAPALPALAAFAALYVVGHRVVMRVGPTVEIFGWNVSLLFDVAVAMGAALATAAVQRLGLRLLESQERRPRRDHLT
jgi:hypothetical protein